MDDAFDLFGASAIPASGGMEDDAFCVFGLGSSARGGAVESSPLLPRASDHPHCSARTPIWPTGESHAGEEGSLRAYVEAHANACSKGLRKSKSHYGRACAAALQAALEAYIASGPAAPELLNHARVARDLCATTLEEDGNWDTPAWQEANLICLSYELTSLLAVVGKGALSAEHASAVGAVATALFNLAVSAACALESEPAWVECVGTLLRHAERAVGMAHLAASLAEADAARWKIPARPPRENTPAIDEARRVRQVDVNELPCSSFFCEHLRPGRAVLIRGHLEAERWGALEYFADLRTLHAEAGGRLVPISLGSPLVGYGGVAHWPLRKLIEEHLLPSNATHDSPRAVGQAPDEETHCSVAYMTQHHLLHQHPALQRLLAVPPHTLGRTLSPTNVWIGTRGTVTSLHSDPSDNLLCQVAGFKYFRLYALSETSKLHATVLRAQNTNSFGTSPVRVEAPIPPEYASAAEAEFVEGILQPGDMLFIPKSVWHYVRSLTTSVSINFWF